MRSLKLALVPLPKYTRQKKLSGGGVGYYWEPPTWAKKKGCPFSADALGADLPLAIARANELNNHFDAWRTGNDVGGVLPGTVAWLFRKIEGHPKFKKTAAKTQRGYLQGFRLIEDFTLPKSGKTFGQVPAKSIKERHVDRLYEGLQWVKEKDGTMRRRLAMANAAMRAARRTWSIAKRAGWVDGNPFLKMELEETGGNTRAAMRAEVEAFVAKADELGSPSMGTAAMLAFELCQREGDVIGTIAWTDYRPGQEIRVRQHKTGQMVWVPLRDDEGELFPGLVDRLDGAPKVGSLIVMRDKKDSRNKIHLPYKEDHFRHLFRHISDAAGLPKDFRFMGLRHGGLTELGNAGATDQELVSHSGHKTRQTLTVYTKPSSAQAANAARKRRAWLKRNSIRQGL